MWALWRTRCLTRRLPPCSTDPASRLVSVIAELGDAFALCAVAIYRDGERASRGEVTLNEAATALALGTTTVRGLIAEGALPASQHCKGALWIIRLADMERDEIRGQANARRSRRPPPDERQKNLYIFQQHQHRQRIVDQRLVKDRKQLLGCYGGNRVTA